MNLLQELEKEQILCVAVGELGIRFVNHRDVDSADVERAIQVLARVLPGLGARTA